MLLYHRLRRVSVPALPLQACYKNCNTNLDTFCPIILLSSSFNLLIGNTRWRRKRKHSYRATLRLLKLRLNKSVRRRCPRSTVASHASTQQQQRCSLISLHHSAKVTVWETWNVASAPRNLLKSLLGFGTVLLVSTLITVKQTEGTSGQW